MRIFDEQDLYKRTRWSLKECYELIEKLKKNNLSIVDTDNVIDLITFQKIMEDDLK